jgi:hydrogenase nickel incorporation protein HypA/HybF
MHELSLCESMMRIVRSEAEANRCRKVKTVRVELGAFCGVAPEALDFCFKVISRGTIADGARLELVHLPGQAWCMHCGETVTIRDRFESCPQCGSYELQHSGGDELRIKELEVE